MPAHATSTPLAPPGSQMLFATAGGGPACPALADTSATFSPPTSPAALPEAAGSGGQKRPRQKTVAAEATRPWPLPPVRRSADEATLPVDEEEGALTQPDNGPYLGISTSSEGRGPVVSLVRPDATTNQASKKASPACTSGFMLKGTGDGTGLDMVVTQRSSDVILGLPYDIIVWSLLLHLICREGGREGEGCGGTENDI